MQGQRILVVDDQAINREIFQVFLKSWGLRPSEASDGPSALQALTQAEVDQDPFTAAILDMQMPGMDGLSLGRVIEKRSQAEGYSSYPMHFPGYREPWPAQRILCWISG